MTLIDTAKPGTTVTTGNTGPHIPAAIFRAYDIRGIVDEQLDESGVFQISRAIGSEALAQGINSLLVGCDGRLSSPRLSQALITGLLSTGCNVINLGRVPTPLLYFAVHTTSFSSGVMLTASHNPANYNGLKIVFGRTALAAEQIQSIRKRVEQQHLVNGTGRYSELDVKQAYIDAIASRIKPARRLKLVIDCANAVAGELAPALFGALGCEVVPLYCEVDGSFPNHHPDPTVTANLQDLAKTVLATQADLGIAFDGDADRLGIVTNRGEVVGAERIIMLLAQQIAPSYPGAAIVFDVKCSRTLPQLIRKLGCTPVMHRSGHSFMKQKMLETDAPLGGEFAAHVFIKDRWFGFDDGMYAAARVVEILTQHHRAASAVFNQFPVLPCTPEISVPVPDEKKFALIDKIVQHAHFPTASKITIDGLRVEFENGWGLVRASNTSPALLLRFEAESEYALTSIQAKFKALILQADKSIELHF